MDVLNIISESGGQISWQRHDLLKGVVNAASNEELKRAHEKVYSELKENNIWIATTEQGGLLTREWPEPPGAALVSFPDQGTALHVLEEIGANKQMISYRTGVMSYSDAIKTANSQNVLLVMVTYEGEMPHYAPISHLGVDETVRKDKKAWWKLW